MSDYENYYDHHSDGFASRHVSDDDVAHSDSDIGSASDGEAWRAKTTDASVVPAANGEARSQPNDVPPRTDMDVHQEAAKQPSAADPWSDTKQIEDVEVFFATFWHSLLLCLETMRSGSADFVSSHIALFVIFLKEAVPVCPDHHLMNMGQVIETVDHLCETLPRIKARNIRRELSVMQRAIDEVKSETVDGLIDEVREQRVLIEKLQAALAQQQAALDQQQTIISSLHAQLAPFLASLPAPSFPSSLSEHSSLQTNFYVRDGVNTKEQRWDGEGRGHGEPKQVSGRVCAGECGKKVIKSGFSKSQWRKAQDGIGKCLSCLGTGD